MSTEICTACGLPIVEGDKKAFGPDGVLHFHCFKRGTAHPREVERETCANCFATKVKGGTCFQCGVGPRVG